MSYSTILFSTQSYTYLLEELCTNYTCYQKGEITTKVFPDGETYHKINTTVHNQNIVLIGGTIDDANTIELYDIAQGIIQLGAKKLTIIIPYFGYATMERSVKNGEIVKAKNRALLFSSLPPCAEPNQIILIDLHSEGIPYYFEKEIHCYHLYAKNLIINECKKIAQNNEFVLASTDAGRAKWVESLANEMGVKSAFVYKQRISGTETQITGVNADVKNQIIIIYDDMIRTGGSLMQAAEVYKNAGASQVFAITTHGLFSNNAIEKISTQNIISKISCTNTHPNCYSYKSSIEIISIANLIHEKITE